MINFQVAYVFGIIFTVNYRKSTLSYFWKPPCSEITSSQKLEGRFQLRSLYIGIRLATVRRKLHFYDGILQKCIYYRLKSMLWIRILIWWDLAPDLEGSGSFWSALDP
jgi:hypothetical protein